MKIAEISADCCPPLDTGLSVAEADQLAAALRILADPARLRLLSMIASAPEGRAACVCELVEPLGLGQPTVSHHLKVLHSAGLLEREKKGPWVYYGLAPAPLRWLQDVIAPLAGT